MGVSPLNWCVAYIHELSMTLIFDLKVKCKRVFNMILCPGHSFFILWHSHTYMVHCQSLGNKCECQGSSDREVVFKFLLAHLSWKLNLSFSDHLSCVVCVFVCLSVRPSVKFSRFQLIQNHWANFNQTWHKPSLGRGDSSLFNALFQGEILAEV